MKKAIFLFVLAGIFTMCLPQTAVSANKSRLPGVIVQQTVQTQHKVYKKRRRVRRHTVTGKSARRQMQLRQGQKHQAEEQKVKKAQQELKKDTTKSN
ncbi:hypothetical protein [Mucilaginibacter flavidus]|uniref:hypothetical protein n=1 Tax=Mucilaginibacter flavidus TaxID=2949309 RepID=UPI002091EB08|nr:hypothetical protein [Mucilaginibacter flavidus]MCO5948940.1 hypothetical protein [Mucilaginibacter flavidus]